MNKKIYYILTAGLAVSVALMVAGYIYAAAIGQKLPASPTDYTLEVYHKQLLQPTGTAPIPSPELLLYAGLLALNLTPISGLLYCLFYFLTRKQYRFFAVALAILLVLAAGAVLGFIREL